MSAVYKAVAEVIGGEAAMELTSRFGGVSLFIPETPNPQSVIALAIGVERAKRLCDTFGGGTIQLPSLQAMEARERRRSIEHCLSQGISHRDIAMRHGITQQRVWQIDKESRKARGEA